jgi:hypothetical protein
MTIFNTVYGWTWWWGKEGRTIDSDTICYLPLRWNLTDKVWNYTWTAGSNLTYDSTLADFPVAYMTYDNWYAYTTTNWPTLYWANSYTISWWVKQANATNAMCIIWYSGNWYNWTQLYKFYQSGTYKWYYVFYIWWYSWSSWFENQYNFNPWTNWNLYTVTYTPWSVKWYINWSQVWSWTSSLTWSTTPNVTIEIGRASHSSSLQQQAYYSDVLFDGKARTAEEISDYYNRMKWCYWIS